NIVVGRLSAPSNTRVAIEVYRPWNDLRRDAGWTAFSAQDDYRTIFGEQVNSQKTKLPLRNFLLPTDRLAAAAAHYSDRQAMLEIVAREGHAQAPRSRQADREVSRFSILSFDSGQNSSNSSAGSTTASEAGLTYSIGFVAMIGDDFGGMQAESNNLMQRLT